MSSSIVLVDVGDALVLEAVFSVDNVNTAPSSPAISVRSPSGVTTTYSGGQLTNTATGVYSVTVDVTESGDWYWRAVGTGAAKAAGERTFRSRRRYVTA